MSETNRQDSRPPDPLPELLDFSYSVDERGVASLSLTGKWQVEPAAEERALVVLASTANNVRRLTPLPSWGPSAPAAAGEGDEWVLVFRMPADTVSGLSCALAIGSSCLLDLPEPRGSDRPAPEGNHLVVAPRAPTTAELAAVREDPQTARSQLQQTARSDLETVLAQRIEMTDALASQNRTLRSRVAELEDALERAHYATTLASHLQALAEAEGRVSQARVDFDTARDALRSEIFESGGGPDQLDEVSDHEQEARYAWEERTQELDAIRLAVLRALPEDA